jgi:hypothetical protein
MLQNALVNYWTEVITKALRCIPSDHAYIHDGKQFYAYHKADITAGATLKFTFTTPAASTGKYVHFRPSVISSSGDKLSMTMTEIPTSVSGGSAMTAYNRNRLSTATCGCALASGVTLTESATVVDASFIGGGTGVGGTRSGAEAQENDEIVLKQDTVYSITLTNDSSATNLD